VHRHLHYWGWLHLQAVAVAKLPLPKQGDERGIEFEIDGDDWRKSHVCEFAQDECKQLCVVQNRTNRIRDRTRGSLDASIH
jgi:hypothetical protein